MLSRTPIDCVFGVEGDLSVQLSFSLTLNLLTFNPKPKLENSPKYKEVPFSQSLPGILHMRPA